MSGCHCVVVLPFWREPVTKDCCFKDTVCTAIRRNTINVSAAAKSDNSSHRALRLHQWGSPRREGRSNKITWQRKNMCPISNGLACRHSGALPRRSQVELRSHVSSSVTASLLSNTTGVAPSELLMGWWFWTSYSEILQRVRGMTVGSKGESWPTLSIVRSICGSNSHTTGCPWLFLKSVVTRDSR